MMKQLLVSLLICSPLLLLAQYNNNKQAKPWQKGEVVLHTGETFHCELRFNRFVTEGLLEIQKGSQVQMLTVKDVRAFSFFDERRHTTRTFYTLFLMPELSTREHEIFVEYVYGNKKFSILNHKTLALTRKFQFNPFKRKAVVDQRYLLDNITGKIVPLSKENALTFMQEQQKEILTYLHDNGMRLKTVSEFINLLEFHQSLL